MSDPPSPSNALVWGQLPASNRRWIVVKAIGVTAAINLVLNAILASLGVEGRGAVPIWGVPLGEPSVFGSAIGTLFFLPLITCLLVTAAIRRDVRVGSLESLAGLRSAHRWLAALPAARLKRGIAFGAISVVLLAPLLALALFVADPAELSEGQFVACQTALAVALGAIATPAIALYAMAEPVH
ncbi:MAG TPA: hypothetical protein VF729_01925 [Solirubrobacterales bacterium]